MKNNEVFGNVMLTMMFALILVIAGRWVIDFAIAYYFAMDDLMMVSALKLLVLTCSIAIIGFVVRGIIKLWSNQTRH